MKVLQINSVSGIRSTGRICTDLSDTLVEAGHECRIAYGREQVPKQYRYISYRIGTDWDVRMHALRTRIFDDTGFGSRKATEDFIKWAKKYDPDIIHLHNIHGYYLNIEILFRYLKEINKPVVWTLHDCWAFTGHCTHFDFIGCDRWKTGCYQCPQKKEYPASYIFDSSRRNYVNKKRIFSSLSNLTIVSPSKWLVELIKQSFLSKYPIQVIHNGIDLEQFRPTPSNFREKHGIEKKVLLLGVAAVWENRKGLNTFLNLAEVLDENVVIVLVGLTKKQLNDLPSNIIGIQRTSSVKELAEIYTAADVLINPTLEDNYPTVNLEAIACGTPVITYETGGSPESLDNNTGIVVARNNFNQLLTVIEDRAFTQFSETDCLIRGKHFSKHIAFARYISLYKKLQQHYLYH